MGGNFLATYKDTILKLKEGATKEKNNNKTLLLVLITNGTVT